MGILDHVGKIRIKDCGEELLMLDPKEFVLAPMYFEWGYTDTNKMYLRSGVIAKLREAKKALLPGWNLKIWDGYRTLTTQKILYENYWQELKKEHPDWTDAALAEAVEIFVSPPSIDPKLPAPHNTGGAVDLTLVDPQGDDLEMGTAFDEFKEASYTEHYVEGLFHENRMNLKELLEGVGFKNYHEEWWHFSYGDQAWALQSGVDTAIYGSMEYSLKV